MGTVVCSAAVRGSFSSNELRTVKAWLGLRYRLALQHGHSCVAGRKGAARGEKRVVWRAVCFVNGAYQFIAQLRCLCILGALHGSLYLYWRTVVLLYCCVGYDHKSRLCHLLLLPDSVHVTALCQLAVQSDVLYCACVCLWMSTATLTRIVASVSYCMLDC
jgi:hypothetical protein